MRKYKIGIIGYFAKGKSKAGGQEAKTCSLDKALRNKFGDESVLDLDTTSWKKRIIKLFLNLITLPVQCENIIMLPAQNSLKFFVPILVVINIFFKRKIFYSVVGGWLPKYLQKHKYLIFFLKRLDKIWVETVSMREALNKLDINNVDVIVNFKYINKVFLDISKFTYNEPYSLCIFSRIMKEKGVEDAIEAVKYVNNYYKRTVIKLDIYGKIEKEYIDRFDEILKLKPSYIIYKGEVEPEKSVEILKDYLAVLFPTRYYTEGIPGTIIDAYTAGVPVICSLWENHRDVFFNEITGLGYEFKNVNALKEILKNIVKNPEKIISMKKNCLAESEKYNPNVVMKKIEKYIEA